MKRIVCADAIPLILFLALSVFISMGCQTIMGDHTGKMPAPEGTAFWRYITDTNPYVKWAPWPGKAGLFKPQGKSPHGPYVKIYINDVVFNAMNTGKASMPRGSIVVLESYNLDGKTVLNITPMYKVAGYNPAAGDWFWATFTAKGGVLEAGKVQSCISCHGDRSGNDWMFSERK